jgi:hypothetical protein
LHARSFSPEKKLLDTIYEGVNGVYNDLDRAFGPLAENREFRSEEVEELVTAIQRFVGQLVPRLKFEAAAKRVEQLQASTEVLKTPKVNDLLKRVRQLSNTLDAKQGYADVIVPQLRQKQIQVDTTLGRRETSAQTSDECHFMRPFGPMFVSVNGQFLRHLDGANCFSPPHLLPQHPQPG